MSTLKRRPEGGVEIESAKLSAKAGGDDPKLLGFYASEAVWSEAGSGLKVSIVSVPRPAPKNVPGAQFVVRVTEPQP